MRPRLYYQQSPLIQNDAIQIAIAIGGALKSDGWFHRNAAKNGTSCHHI